uniref:CX domain-containing protein n=1 Tax=Heterorhabditis bacteriophora TaxID=37862 RepID=A0A1I7WQJ1_HETBA
MVYECEVRNEDRCVRNDEASYLMPRRRNPDAPAAPKAMRQMAPTLQSGAPMPAPAPPQPMNPAPSPLEFRIHDMNRRLYIFNSSGYV